MVDDGVGWRSVELVLSTSGWAFRLKLGVLQKRASMPKSEGQIRKAERKEKSEARKTSQRTSICFVIPKSNAKWIQICRARNRFPACGQSDAEEESPMILPPSFCPIDFAWSASCRPSFGLAIPGRISAFGLLSGFGPRISALAASLATVFS